MTDKDLRKRRGSYKGRLTFLALSITERLSALPNYKVCFNCFRRGHYATTCRKSCCKICKRKHHTLIHCTDFKQKTSSDNTADRRNAHDNCKDESIPTTNGNSGVTLAANISAHSNTCTSTDVLLSTALVKCYDSHNKEYVARALLDSGSSSCLMTEKLCKQLNLPIAKVDRSIYGINNSLTHIGKMCSVHIKSLSESYSCELKCFVLPNITDNVPARQINLRNISIPTDVHLADPNFHTPAEIDLIIGADLFWCLLGSRKISLGTNKPILYETRLGWLVSGPINGGYMMDRSDPVMCNFTKVDSYQSSSDLCNLDDIQNQLTRFWQLEEVSRQSSSYSIEEQNCEDHFVKNMTRLEDGRFCVKIPLKNSPEVLGDSLQRAKRCFLSMERRNMSQPPLDKMYKEFMSEYISLGHMSESIIDKNKINYFLPHHGVLREHSLTTKLRVVFNASAPTTSGMSLNNLQMVGPTVQDDLLSILIRFRLYRYVLSADVEKMYRQVSVHPSDRHLQQIVWRDDMSSPLKVYELNTVSYGTASAPFLATRCLKQIGIECSDKDISEVIIHDFYVDDLLTGADQINQALSIRNKVTQALASACMPLRKWRSNEPALLCDKQKIIDKTQPYTWRHVPTNVNPADLLSRGVDANDIESSNTWWSGPTFLLQDESSWPCIPGTISDLPELKTNGSCDTLSECVASEGITFHFIPAYAPHFGGLWEAGVKSTKFHLVRVLGNCRLTYEELNTTLVQIEAILNSRPLTPLSSDPEDMMPLTPAHFMIGRPLTSLPVKDLRDHSNHHLTRHQRVEQLRQHFWERWNKEYVSELQQRVKWHTTKDSLKLNSLVVIKDDNLPPLKWKLGRIVALYPGNDGVPRVADIKTSTGVVRRAFSKICTLIEDFC
ncbi:uncharacterized protein LOC135077244 [Ostrinia nubilalis]|uniref:uncharacterized protein LOC135077244 n=1 Tax=Ostrinia nubilalis TaxID=29057 RepID=UPI003082333C